MIRKPSDCTCGYPKHFYTDITGHASDCPTYHRIRQTVTIHKDVNPPKRDLGESQHRLPPVYPFPPSVFGGDRP